MTHKQYRHLPAFLVCSWIVCAAASCFQAAQPSAVQFGIQQPIGRWQATDSSGGAATATPAAGSSSSTLGQAGVVAMSAAGRPATAAGSRATGSGGVGAAGRMGAAGATGAAGMGGAAGATSSGGLATLAFDVTTASQGGRYQPKNIGAIWVQDATGRFMKSLEVWAGIRSRYLTKYSAARGGMAVDVTASATLSGHRAHHATWNMKDRSGAAAAPGKYTLFVELTDADVTGKYTSVDFDTSLGPQTVNPPDASYYTNMKLQLQ
jgi:hypothetical protein